MIRCFEAGAVWGKVLGMETICLWEEDSGPKWVSVKVHTGPCTPGFLPFSSS